jgi:hypothetical protein
MTSDSTHNKFYSFLLGGLLVLTLFLVGIQVTYHWYSRLALGLILFLVNWSVAWKAGASALCSTDTNQRQLALSGMLLIAPWTLFAFLIGIGTPDVASQAENQLRYLVLTVNASLVVGGIVVLCQWLNQVNEGLFSKIGLWCAIPTAVCCIVFSQISLVQARAIERSLDAGKSLEWRMIDELSLTLLYFGALFTYGATAAIATSLSRARVLGSTTGRTLGVLSLLAIALLVLHMVQLFSSSSNILWNFANWYSIVGQVVAIPAVPWIMLGVLGVLLLSKTAASDFQSTK